MSRPLRVGDEVRLGTRGSALARRQTADVASLLAAVWPQRRFVERVISTTGDRRLDTSLQSIEGKGLFTAELEQALRDGDIEGAVHSLKDLPVEEPAGLVVAAVPARESWRDVLLSPGAKSYEDLRRGACVGTGSVRRAAQLLGTRPDLCTRDLRGNVETRLRKLRDPELGYDAIVMAEAAIERLQLRGSRLLEGLHAVPLATGVMLPAPGQGALAVQCRDETNSVELFAPIDHPPTAAAVAAERAFLEGLGGGCSAPVAALGEVDTDGTLRLTGRVCAPDGARSVELRSSRLLPLDGDRDAMLAQARATGRRLAVAALDDGADALMTERTTG